MSDVTDQILIDIRNELRDTRGELREMRVEIRGTNTRLDRVVQEQIRHATAIVGLENRLGNAIEGMNARLDNVFIGGMGQTVREHESRIQRVEEHLRLGPPPK
jgi:hypothetical protein